jgi:hypothetical protein
MTWQAEMISHAVRELGVRGCAGRRQRASTATSYCRQ